MTRQMVALDKEPGTRPVGFGCIWLRVLAKMLMEEMKGDAKEACGAKQLCAGLEAEIEGGLRAVIENARRLGGMRFTDGDVDEEVLAGAADTSSVGGMEGHDSGVEGHETSRGGKRARL